MASNGKKVMEKFLGNTKRKITDYFNPNAMKKTKPNSPHYVVIDIDDDSSKSPDRSPDIIQDRVSPIANRHNRSIPLSEKKCPDKPAFSMVKRNMNRGFSSGTNPTPGEPVRMKKDDSASAGHSSDYGGVQGQDGAGCKVAGENFSGEREGDDVKILHKNDITLNQNDCELVSAGTSREENSVDLEEDGVNSMQKGNKDVTDTTTDKQLLLGAVDIQKNDEAEKSNEIINYAVDSAGGTSAVLQEAGADDRADFEPKEKDQGKSVINENDFTDVGVLDQSSHGLDEILGSEDSSDSPILGRQNHLPRGEPTEKATAVIALQDSPSSDCLAFRSTETNEGRENVVQNVAEENVTANVASGNVTEKVVKENITVSDENGTTNVASGNATGKVVKENITVSDENVTANVAAGKVSEKVAEENVTQNVDDKNSTSNVAVENATRKVADGNVSQNVSDEKITANVTAKTFSEENVAGETPSYYYDSRNVSAFDDIEETRGNISSGAIDGSPLVDKAEDALDLEPSTSSKTRGTASGFGYDSSYYKKTGPQSNAEEGIFSRNRSSGRSRGTRESRNPHHYNDAQLSNILADRPRSKLPTLLEDSSELVPVVSSANHQVLFEKVDSASKAQRESFILPSDPAAICQSFGDEPRWNIIQQVLHRDHDRDHWTPDNLIFAVETLGGLDGDNVSAKKLGGFIDRLPHQRRLQFLSKDLRLIVKLALRMPELFKENPWLLKKGQNISVSLTQEQAACLVAHMFFCSFPARTWGSYPDRIDFRTIYSRLNERVMRQKLFCLINYLGYLADYYDSRPRTNHGLSRAEPDHTPNGVITITRQAVEEPDWTKFEKEVGISVDVMAEGAIEQDEGLLQVDFANKFIGGGVLGYGAVQEEIRFLICPELLVTLLLCESMEDNEAIFITGAQQFSKYSGYSATFCYTGCYRDNTPRDSYDRKLTSLVAIDATSFNKSVTQFSPRCIRRELWKAYAGFSTTRGDKLAAVATGNWGCGAFRGDSRLKAVIQLISSSAVGRSMRYYTFGDSSLKKDIEEIVGMIDDAKITVSSLYQIVMRFAYSREAKNGFNFFKYLKKKLDGSETESEEEMAEEIEDISSDSEGRVSDERMPKTAGRPGALNEIEGLQPECLGDKEDERAEVEDYLSSPVLSKRKSAANSTETESGRNPVSAVKLDDFASSDDESGNKERVVSSFRPSEVEDEVTADGEAKRKTENFYGKKGNNQKESAKSEKIEYPTSESPSKRMWNDQIRFGEKGAVEQKRRAENPFESDKATEVASIQSFQDEDIYLTSDDSAIETADKTDLNTDSDIECTYFGPRIQFILRRKKEETSKEFEECRGLPPSVPSMENVEKHVMQKLADLTDKPSYAAVVTKPPKRKTLAKYAEHEKMD